MQRAKAASGEKQKVCAACKASPARWVKEHRPGAIGRMAHSFAGEYYLCDACLEKLAGIGAVERQVWHGRRPKRRRCTYTIVKAKSFAWLRSIR